MRFGLTFMRRLGNKKRMDHGNNTMEKCEVFSSKDAQSMMRNVTHTQLHSPHEWADKGERKGDGDMVSHNKSYFLLVNATSLLTYLFAHDNAMANRQGNQKEQQQPCHPRLLSKVRRFGACFPTFRFFSHCSATKNCEVGSAR
jgi:hypothetical protein